MWIWGLIAFFAGAFLGMFLTALLSANNTPYDKIRELKKEMTLRMSDYYRQFKDQHGSAYDRAIAKGVVQEALSIIRNTEV